MTVHTCGRCGGLLALVLASCAPHASPMPSIRLSPAQAVINAAEMPAGISGVFEMAVRASGRQGGFLYINSEQDYRDPRNLTIVISPAIEAALEKRFGRPVETALLTHVIAARGTARKVKIYFSTDGHLTNKYYFQTHLRLMSERDLTLEGERPSP